MSSQDPPPRIRPDLTESSATIPSDSENYSSSQNELSPSPEPSSNQSPPLILYSPPTVWGIIRGAAINILLPFVNGLMLGFGELFAHEAAFRLGWSGTRVGLLGPSHEHTPFFFSVGAQVHLADELRTGLSKWTEIQACRTGD